MIEIEQLELEFYRNGLADNVLQRFKFSEKEEKLICDAIRTANMSNPRMQLIHKANELLREVTKTREPIRQEKKTRVSAEVVAHIELLKLNTAKRQKEQASIDKTRTFFGFKSKYGVVFVVLMSVGFIAIQYFQTKPINDAMQEQEKHQERQRNLMLGVTDK